MGNLILCGVICFLVGAYLGWGKGGKMAMNALVDGGVVSRDQLRDWAKS